MSLESPNPTEGALFFISYDTYIAIHQFPLFKIFCKMIKKEKVKMNELYEVVVLRR
jgi:hypothetical protein